MKNFIIFFMANTGSSAIISHLKQLKEKIDIVGFEPFDNFHMKTPLIGDDLTKIFNLIYNNINNSNINQINNIYKKYTDKELKFDTTKSVGCKMRFRNWDMIEGPIKNGNTTVFILIRQNVFKWAISSYDSKSTQFDLLKGKISKDPQITIDLVKFKQILSRCEQSLKERYELVELLKKRNINIIPIYYEEFCDNKKQFFKKFLNAIDIKLSDELLTEFANKPNYFKKVHSDDLRKYITNYDQLKKEFKEYDF
jgi:hypothetical protein